MLPYPSLYKYHQLIYCLVSISLWLNGWRCESVHRKASRFFSGCQETSHINTSYKNKGGWFQVGRFSRSIRFDPCLGAIAIYIKLSTKCDSLMYKIWPFSIFHSCSFRKKSLLKKTASFDSFSGLTHLDQLMVHQGASAERGHGEEVVGTFESVVVEQRHK